MTRVFHPIFEDSSVRSESCIAAIIVVIVINSCKKDYIVINWIEYLFVLSVVNRNKYGGTISAEVYYIIVI
jgi:hypothetical protein